MVMVTFYVEYNDCNRCIIIAVQRYGSGPNVVNHDIGAFNSCEMVTKVVARIVPQDTI